MMHRNQPLESVFNAAMRKNLWLAISGFIALCFISVGVARDAPVPLNSVREGTYFLRNMYSTTILDLKDGRFRYWFSSDMRSRHEPTYPLSGNYTTNGGTITLLHESIHETNWTFMTFEGSFTLWRPSALKSFGEDGRADPYGVLRPTTEKPEDIWERKGFRKKADIVGPYPFQYVTRTTFLKISFLSS